MAQWSNSFYNIELDVKSRKFQSVAHKYLELTAYLEMTRYTIDL